MVTPKIEVSNSWDAQKQDPTEFDAELNVIRVRGDYDADLDLCGWIVHEKVHAYLASINYQDDYNPPVIQYPFNSVERMAYTWQFIYLIKANLALCLGDIKKMMPWKFERFGNKWAEEYWENALGKGTESAPFAKVFLDIVEKAILKRCACSKDAKEV